MKTGRGKNLLKMILARILRGVWRSSPSRGFTLVEVMATALIFAVVAGACFVALNSGMRSWRVNNAQVELQQELRKAMDWMIEDLRQSGTSGTAMNVPADGTWYGSVTFRIAVGVSGSDVVWSSGTIRYALGGTDSHTLQRTTSAGFQVIAQGIETLSLRRQAATPHIIEIRLTAKKDTPAGGVLRAATAFKVRLRN